MILLYSSLIIFLLYLADERKLERFIWSSLPSGEERSKGKYTYVYHFDAKAEVEKYIRTEKAELWAKTSVLHVGFYMTNMINMAHVFKPREVSIFKNCDK